MQFFAEWPPVLIRKWLLLALIGAGCLIVGLIMLIVVHDLGLLYLSVLLALMTAARCVTLYRRIDRLEYETVEGVCTASSRVPFLHGRKVCLLTEDGEQHDFIADCRKTLQVGRQYRIYFFPGNTGALSDAKWDWFSRPRIVAFEWA